MTTVPSPHADPPGPHQIRSVTGGRAVRAGPDGRLRPGICIATGAVAAAGAAVTREVELMRSGQEPARLLRRCLGDEQCAELPEAQRWQHAFPGLVQPDLRDPRRFPEQLSDPSGPGDCVPVPLRSRMHPV